MKNSQHPFQPEVRVATHVIVTSDVHGALMAAAERITARADSVIRVDALGNQFRSVFANDITALQDAIRAADIQMKAEAIAAQRREAENARLIAAATDLLEAVAGSDPEMPAQIRPIEWLHTLLQDAEKIHSVLDGDDPSAADMMLDELRTMVTKARAAIEAVREG
jgi:hypothetical protein